MFFYLSKLLYYFQDSSNLLIIVSRAQSSVPEFVFFFCFRGDAAMGFDRLCWHEFWDRSSIRAYISCFSSISREKRTACITCSFGQFSSTKVSFIDHATNCFDRSVQCYRQIKLPIENQFFWPLIVAFIGRGSHRKCPRTLSIDSMPAHS